MIKITVNDILNLLDAAKEMGIVPFATNDVIKTDDWRKNNYFGDYRYLYFCFNVYKEIPLNEKCIDKQYFYDKGYVCGSEYIVTLGAYYKCYLEVFGIEPFNLVQEMFDYIEVGGEYGWHGNPFNICTYKKLSKNGTITAKFLYCNSNAGLPMFSKEFTERFKLNPKNENLMHEIKSLQAMVKYPNQAHYPLNTSIIVNGKKENLPPSRGQDLDIIKSTEKAIRRNQQALKILKQIKKKKTK